MAKTERGTREEEGNGESSEKHWVIFLGYAQVAVALWWVRLRRECESVRVYLII